MVALFHCFDTLMESFSLLITRYHNYPEIYLDGYVKKMNLNTHISAYV